MLERDLAAGTRGTSALEPDDPLPVRIQRHGERGEVALVVEHHQPRLLR